MEKTLEQIAHEAIETLPKSMLWRLVDAFEQHSRAVDADDLYAKLSDVQGIIGAACREAVEHFAAALVRAIEADRSYVPNGYLWQHFLSLIDAERQRRPQ